VGTPLTVHYITVYIFTIAEADGFLVSRDRGCS
jgi:hypothetical protein